MIPRPARVVVISFDVALGFWARTSRTASDLLMGVPLGDGCGGLRHDRSDRAGVDWRRD